MFDEDTCSGWDDDMGCDMDFSFDDTSSLDDPFTDDICGSIDDSLMSTEDVSSCDTTDITADCDCPSVNPGSGYAMATCSIDVAGYAYGDGPSYHDDDWLE